VAYEYEMSEIKRYSICRSIAWMAVKVVCEITLSSAKHARERLMYRWAAGALSIFNMPIDL
jgi:hypothetical protein